MYLLGVSFLLIARLGLQAFLYHSGFESLTADEFAWTVLAARWAQSPYAAWSGRWLPFQMYVLGIALRLRWDLFYIPRAIVISLGVVSIVLMYQLASRLFESRKTGLVSAVLLAVNPVHAWLSSTPLAEMPQMTLVLASMLSLVLYLKSKKKQYIYVSAFALALASGFRYESWMFSIVFSFYLIGEGILQLWRKEADVKGALTLITAAFIPWMFPVAWILGNYIEMGDPLYFITAKKLYKLTWYGPSRSYIYYLQTFLKIDPYVTIFGILGLVICLLYYRQSRPIQWYVATAVIPFSVFAYLHGGQIEPPGNFFRYLAPFIFIVYPAFAWLINSAVEHITRSDSARSALLAMVVLVIAITQIHTTFQFTNDPAADGLRVGKRIMVLREEHPELSQRPVLIELSYWQYLAMHTGANDISLLVYDRELDFERRQTTSLLLSDLDAVRRCLALYDISYIVVRAPELKGVVEQNLGILPSEEVNHYYFYQVPHALREAQVYEGSCPLGHDPFGVQP